MAEKTTYGMTYSMTMQDRIEQRSETGFPFLVVVNFLCFVGLTVAAFCGSVPWCIFAGLMMLSIDIDLLRCDRRRHHKQLLAALSALGAKP